MCYVLYNEHVGYAGSKSLSFIELSFAIAIGKRKRKEYLHGFG